MQSSIFVIIVGLFYQPGIPEHAAFTKEDAEEFLKREGYTVTVTEANTWEKNLGADRYSWWAQIQELDVVNLKS